jgi:signal transduction histidine kinase
MLLSVGRFPVGRFLARRRQPAVAAVLATLVLLVGFVATGLIFVELRAAQRAAAERVMDQRTATAQAAVRAEIERYRSVVAATAAGIAIDDELTWDDFDAASAPLSAAGLVGAASVAYVAPVSTAGAPAAQRLWRSRGAEGLVLRPATTGEEHYFSIFTRPLNGASAPLNGIDVAASAEATQALLTARDTSQVAVSDTYVLLRDRGLPPARQQLSFIFAAPLWTRAAEPVFRGWVVLGLRGQDFLRGMLDAVSQGQLGGELVAANSDGSRPTVARFGVAGDTDLVRAPEIPVADRTWTLITRADPAQLPGARSSLPSTVLAGGAAITLILAGLVHVLATGRARAWARVQEATADLRRAEGESRRQAGLLAAIMTSLGDGVGVVDEHGAFLLHNPAARKLLGVAEDVDDPAAWQQHYGLFRPDGRTPYPVDELPLIRALRGESSDGVEMLVRNPGRPEGVLLSVDGRPLDPSAGQRGAVAVFRDITEMRRYETDLAVFAGVVAHDLKAPLTVVRGHCEMAADELAAAPAGPEVAAAGAALQRVARAVDRMTTLIDTLLAYATARDAPLRTRVVDLGALVAEVVQDRIAHLGAADRPAVRIGPLPPVHADPAMLRHLVDNLIGNAVKYVRPGTVAQVEVTGEATGGCVRVEIADRGIGIPDADKPDVFERFHRAHAAAGYTGTGLGLAICRRIVERHGGAIGVADNPGGGTRVHFTLPAAVPAGERPAREALDRALAERALIESAGLPGLTAHDPSAVSLRSPVPDRRPGPRPENAAGAEADRARQDGRSPRTPGGSA